MGEQQDSTNQAYANAYQAYPYYYYPQAQSYQQTYDPRQQPQQFPQVPQFTGPVQDQDMLLEEQSYIENILRLNKGKMATVYMTFENNSDWNAKIFKGIIEAAGRDHIILSDPQTGKRYLLLMIYLDYITFDEELNYAYPYGANPNLATYPPR